MDYIYNDEDNAPMNDDDPFLGAHNPTVYQSLEEMKAWESGEVPFDDPPEDGCWNCQHYDGDHCTKEWNNGDKQHYVSERDDKEFTDWCEDWDRDENAVANDWFGEDEEDAKGI